MNSKIHRKEHNLFSCTPWNSAAAAREQLGELTRFADNRPHNSTGPENKHQLKASEPASDKLAQRNEPPVPIHFFCSKLFAVCTL